MLDHTNDGPPAKFAALFGDGENPNYLRQVWENVMVVRRQGDLPLNRWFDSSKRSRSPREDQYLTAIEETQRNYDFVANQYNRKVESACSEKTPRGTRRRHSFEADGLLIALTRLDKRIDALTDRYTRLIWSLFDRDMRP